MQKREFVKFACLDKWLSAVKDYHIPVTIVVFIVGTVLQWYNHFSADYVAFAVAILGAVTGHSFSPAGQPDAPVTNVEVTNVDAK